MQFRSIRREPDHSAALAQYRRRAGNYDQELAVFEPIRADAIECLQLKPGATVLDVGCGTGLSFQPLHDRLGKAGHIVGIEQCPEMIERAGKRVQQSHWNNVDLVCASAASAQLDTQADAALFHFTHDILREDAAIVNMLAHLKPGARVVAAGLQWASPWLWPANGFVAAAAFYSVTSFEGLREPWDKLAAHLADVQIRDALLGAIFIATGTYAPAETRH